MAEPREAKLRRLDAFRRALPHVSGRALAAILDKVRRDGVPELHGRCHLQEAREIASYGDTPFGPIQQTIDLEGVDGAAIPLEVQHPLATLYHACKQGGSFSDYMRAMLIEQPPGPADPWHLVMYTDGLTPGDAFKTQNLRKLDVVYFSMLELGVVALCKEDSWFMISAKRTGR